WDIANQAIPGNEPADLTEDATLMVAGSLGMGAAVQGGNALQLADLNGDGLLDLAVTCPRDGSGGQIAVWNGAFATFVTLVPGTPVTPAPDYILKGMGPSVVPIALGSGANGPSATAAGQLVRFADLDGDGFIDVIGVDPSATVNTLLKSGAVGVWLGSTAN